MKDDYQNYLKKLKHHRKEYLMDNGKMTNLQDLVIKNNNFLDDYFYINQNSENENVI